jgi:serine/threonine protein kinase
MVGTVLGSYRIVEACGEDRLGAVFRAIDVSRDREVAIRRLDPSLIGDEHRLGRLRAETRILARLRHPNIARFYELLVHDESCFLVTEYVAGESLRHLIQRPGSLRLETALESFCQALRGITQAHAQSVVHGAISSGGFVRTPDGTVKVLDFGIARVLGTDCRLETGTTSDRQAYRSPEQCEGREPGTRSDIYALGMVLRELVTGQAPPADPQDDGAIAPHPAMRPPSIERPADLPEAVASAIERALHRDPDARFATAGEFRRAVEHALQAPSPALVRHEPRHGVNRAPAAGPRRRRSLAAGACASGAVVLLALLMWGRFTARPALSPAESAPPRAIPVRTPDLDGEIGARRQPPAGPASIKAARLAQPDRQADAAIQRQPSAVTAPPASVRSTRSFRRPEPSGTAPVIPQLVGLRLARAESIARSAGFRLILNAPAPDRRPRGSVITQRPPAGERPTGEYPAIRVTPSSGPPLPRLPDLVGERLPQARAIAREKGFTLVVRGTVPSSSPEGTVTRQTPSPGARVSRPGRQIRVSLSAGLPRIPTRMPRPPVRAAPIDRNRVPPLVGLTTARARLRARQGGYWLVFHGFVPHPARRGTVVWQDPPAGAPATGGRFIGFRASDGPSP